MTGVVAGEDEPRCPRCQSVELKKLISRVSRGRSEDARLDAMADRLENADLDDERAVRRFAREMGREMGADTGEDLADEFEAMMQEEADGEGSYGDSNYGGGNSDDGTIY